MRCPRSPTVRPRSRGSSASSTRSPSRPTFSRQNAKVEAARAGEAGRGFAVVALEVGALAQRSAVAANEIATPIGQSAEQVKTGEGLVNEAGEAIAQIRSAITRILHRRIEITEAATYQTARMDEVTRSVRDTDRMTQRQAAMAEAAATLAQCVASFRLDQADQTGMTSFRRAG